MEHYEDVNVVGKKAKNIVLVIHVHLKKKKARHLHFNIVSYK